MAELRPYDPAIDKPRQNSDGSQSTEISRTVQTGEGEFANVPSLWFGDGVGPQDFGSETDDQLALRATNYEAKSGKKFPRFKTVDEAVTVAKARSDAGGATVKELAVAPDTRPMGARKVEMMHEAGASDDEIVKYKTQASQIMREANASQDEIDQYWGDYNKPSKTLEKGVRDNLRGGKWDESKLTPTDPNSWIDAWYTGWGWSAAGLSGGAAPQHKPLEYANSPMVPYLIQTAGSLTGDLPYNIIGGIAGTGLGAAVGAESGPGAVIPAAIGGGAGLMFAPAWVREYYLDGLRNGEYQDFNDYIKRQASVTLEASKEAVVGAILGPVGEVGGPLVGKMAKPVMGEVLSKAADQATKMVAWGTGGATIHAAYEHRMPTLDELGEGAFVMGALGLVTHGAIKITKAGKPVLTRAGERIKQKLGDIYRDTGMTPSEVVRTVHDVPAARQALAAHTWEGDTATDKFKVYGPPAPEGAKPPPEVDTGEPKPADTGPTAELQKQMEETKPVSVPSNAHVSEENGLRNVNNVSPQRLIPLLKGEKMFDEASGMRGKVNDPVEFEKLQVEKLRELLPKFKNKDGTIDIESALAAYHSGFAKASLFRSSGRDYLKLPMDTRRFLEKMGDELEQTGAFEHQERSPTAEEKAKQAKIDEQVAEAKKIEDQKQRANAMPIEQLRDNFTRIPKGPPRHSWQDWYRWARYKWGKFYPASQFDKLFNEKSEEGVGLDGLMRLQIASGGRFINRIEAGGLKPVKDPVGHKAYDLDPSVPSMKSVYDEAKKREGGLEEFDRIQRAAHTIDVAAITNETKDNLYEAQALMRKEGGKWADLLKKDRLVRDSMIDRLVESSMISREQATQWRVDHPNWHPETDEGLGEKIKALHDWEFAAQLNENRKFAANVFRKNGMLRNETVAEEPSDFDYSKAPQAHPSHGKIKTIEWLEDGIKHTAELQVPLSLENIADMLMNDHYVSPMALTKLLAKFGQVTRSFALGNPVVLGRIMMKDGIQAFISSKEGGKPFLNTFRGLVDVTEQVTRGRVSKDGAVLNALARYEANGGYSMSVAWLDHSDILKEMRKDKRKWFGPLGNLQSYGEAFHGVIRNSDAATRVGGAFHKGEPIHGTVGASIAGRLIHGDFGEPSTSRSIKWASSVMPFTVAHMRGSVDAFARAWKRDPKGVFLRGATYTLMTTLPLYLYAANFEKNHPDMPEAQKFRNLPAYQRYLFAHIPFVINGTYHDFPIPVAWGMGEAFHGAMVSFLDFFSTDDPQGFKEWGDAMIQEFSFDNPMLANPFIKPFIETWANKNWDYGGPLVNQGELQRSGYQRYDNNTSETAKTLSYYIGPQGADILDWSPKFTDRFVDDWLGGTGLKILKTLEAPVKEYKQTPTDWLKAVGAHVSDLWLGSSYLRLNQSTQPITDFYNLYERAQKVHSDYARGIKTDDQAMIVQAMTDPAWQIDVKDMRKKVMFLAGQRNIANAIENNTQMTVSEKHAALDNIANMMIVVAKQSAQAAKEASK